MFTGSPAATPFYQAFYTQLVQEIFAVMTGKGRCRVESVQCAYDTCVGRVLSCHLPTDEEWRMPAGLVLPSSCLSPQQRCLRVFMLAALLHTKPLGRTIMLITNIFWLFLSCPCSLPAPCPFPADTFHKPGFKLQTRILHHLFAVAQVRGKGEKGVGVGWVGSHRSRKQAVSGPAEGAVTMVGAGEGGGGIWGAHQCQCQHYCITGQPSNQTRH